MRPGMPPCRCTRYGRQRATSAASRSPRAVLDRRRSALASPWLAAADRRSRDPLLGSRCGSSTTCTARAAGDFAVGARPAGAALAPSATSSSTPPMRRRALYEVHVCELTGMFRAHVNIFATRSHAERASFPSPHSRRSPRHSPPCSARHRARRRTHRQREPMRAIRRPITQPLTQRASDADTAGWRALTMHDCDH